MPSVTIPEMNREVYETVVKSIYADPKKASIREILANAVDANKEVAKKFKTDVRKVTMNIGYDSISIRDYGFGMSPDIIKDIYGSMYQSTKRSPYKDAITEANGEHGIGSKAPYGYLYSIEGNGLGAQFYTVTTINNGIKYCYIMFLNEHGIPSYDLIYEQETDDENGTEVTLPFSYIKNCETNDITKLILVMLPFYMEDFGALVELTGENQKIIDIINHTSTTSVHKHGRLYMCDLGVYGIALSKESIEVKYKNILYPFDTSGYVSFTRKNNSRLSIFYDIDLNDLNAPLETNRSRDRIEWNDSVVVHDIATKIEGEVNDMFSKTQAYFETLIENSKLTSTIRHNNVIETLRSLSYNDSLADSIKSLESKKLLRKKFIEYIKDDTIDEGEKELLIWKELFRVPENVISSALDAAGINSFEFLYTILKNFKLYRYFNIDGIQEKVSVSREIVNFHVGPSMKEVSIDPYVCGGPENSKPVFGGTNSYIIQSSINAILNNSNTVFIVRDTKSFKNECHAFLIDNDQNDDYDTTYFIDTNTRQYTAKHIADTFKKEGVKNVFLTSELSEKYADLIKDIKVRQKKDKNVAVKRVKGIRYLGYRRFENTTTVSISTRKTINSDILESMSGSVDTIRVLKTSETDLTVVNQDNDVIIGTYTYNTEGLNTIPYDSSVTLNLTHHNGTTNSVKNDDLLSFLNHEEALVVVEDEHYDSVMEYFDDDLEIKEFNDVVKDVLSSFVSHIYATPTLNDLKREVRTLHNKDVDTYTNKLFNAVNNYIDMSMKLYDFKDFSNPMAEYTKRYHGKVYGIFVDFVEYHTSKEIETIAVKMYDEFLYSRLATTIIHGINMYSLAQDRDALLEFFEHINTIIDMKFFIENYLTDKE